MAELVSDGGIGEPQDGSQKQPDGGARTATTWEGCSVLLDINDGDRLVFARLSPAASVKIGNKKLPLSPLIGCPFGSSFSVESGAGAPRLERCMPTLSSVKILQESYDGCIVNGSKDNRSLIDNNRAQNLSSDDIDTMRRDGATGDEIIEALIANSSTYQQKTQYSQEKYKRKKQKKYAPKVLLRRPSARSICETYFKKHPNRTGFLRVDSLSLLLSMANIGAYSDALVVDMVGGLVVGAVAERLGGTGCVCSTYFGAKPNPIDIVRMFNFDNEVCSRIFQVPFSDLHKSHDNLNLDLHSDDSKLPVLMESVSSDSLRSLQPEQMTEELDLCLGEQIPEDASTLCVGADDPLSLDSCSVSNIDLKSENNTSISHGQQKAGRAPSAEVIELWKTRGFTSLIVATADSDVSRIAQELLVVLSYSAPFAIYHQYLQPLATCMNMLQKSKMAINLQITEPWLREYQVLPSRTHPMMQMSASGGYILSGTRICNDEFCNRVN